MDTQPPIDYYGQSIPRFQRRSWDGPADWTFLFRSGRGNDTRFKNHNHTYKHPIIIALALRKQGKGIKQIGKHLGCNHGHVSAMIKPFGLDVEVKASDNPQTLWTGYLETEITSHAKAERAYDRAWRDVYHTPKTAMDSYYKHHEKNKQRSRERASRRYYELRDDPCHRIKRALRNAITRVVRVYKGIKKQRTQTYLGCTHQQARDHIQSLFKPGMTWGTHGTAWEIDHIRPMSSYDFTKQEDIHACCHFTNLQPLWKNENRTKSDKWENNEGVDGVALKLSLF